MKNRSLVRFFWNNKKKLLCCRNYIDYSKQFWIIQQMPLVFQEIPKPGENLVVAIDNTGIYVTPQCIWRSAKWNGHHRRFKTDIIVTMNSKDLSGLVITIPQVPDGDVFPVNRVT